MIVYHGSYIEVAAPDIMHSRNNVDFGKGFYVTPIKEQAGKWASRFKIKNGQGIVSVYEFNLGEIRSTAKILEFKAYTEEWLDYITTCRREINTITYDVVIGGVANDKVFNTIELYLENLIEKKEAIKRLRYEKPNSQICISNQVIINANMKFLGSEVL